MPPAGKPTVSSESSSIPTADEPEHSAVDLIMDFFDVYPRKIPNKGPWSKDNQTIRPPNIAWPNTDARSSYTIDFLIATLPDPTAPALRDKFDGSLDAIERALDDAGYVIDRLDLPWPTSAGDESKKPWPEQSVMAEFEEPSGSRNPLPPSGAGAENGPPNQARKLEFQVKSESSTNRVSEDPGIILFRSKLKSKLLVLFLIGERPTKGVEKKPLRSALDQIAWLSRWKPFDVNAADYVPNTSTPVRIVRMLAPSFSGSADSIGVTIRSWLDSFHGDPRVHVKLVSGSATEVREKLSNWGVDDFHSTVIGVSTRDFASWARTELGARGEVAILAEAGTSYGETYSAADRKKPNSDELTVLSLDFPLHISDLRAALAQQEPATSGQNGPKIGPSHVPIPVEQSNQNDYIAPLYSPRSSTYDDLVLSNILTTISREHIHYVGIAATDTEDRLFLSHMIRIYCPDTQIVQFNGNNLLYLHPDVNSDLLGTITLSTYPLFNTNQAWTYPFSGQVDRAQFAEEQDEGIYNATMSLLDHPEQMLDYSAPFKNPPTDPVIWESIVGRDAIWPVKPAKFPSHKPDQEKHILKVTRGTSKNEIELGSELYPTSLVVAFILLNVFCSIPSVLIYHYSAGEAIETGTAVEAPARLRTVILSNMPVALGKLLSQSIRPRLREAKRIYSAAFASGLLTTYVIGSALFLLPLRATLKNGNAHLTFPLTCWLLLAGLAAIACTILILMAVAAPLNRVRQGWISTKKKVPPKSALTVLAVTWVVFAFGIWFVTQVWCQDPATALFFFLRSASLRDGVSCLTPMILLAIAAACLVVGELWRLNLLDECRVRRPFLNFSEKAFVGLHELEHELVRSLDRTPLRVPGALMVVASLTVAFVFLLDATTLQRSVDGIAFKSFFFLVVWFVYVEFSLSLLRFAFIWTTLRRLLRYLYWHPTGTSYERLRVGSVPASMTEKQNIKIMEPRPTFKALEFCLTRAQELTRQARTHPCADSETLIGRLQQRSRRIVTLVKRSQTVLAKALTSQAVAFATPLSDSCEHPWRKTILDQLLAERAMAVLSRSVTSVFDQEWGLRLPTTERSDDELDHRLIANAELFVASRVVDLLRRVTPHLLNLATLSTAGLVAITLAVGVYRFPLSDRFAWFSWLILLCAVGVNVTVLISMNRDRVISMLSGTIPGKLNWNGSFVLQLLIFAVIPILSLLGVQFPGPLQALSSWLSGTGAAAGYRN
jgi:hypothetical protein